MLVESLSMHYSAFFQAHLGLFCSDTNHTDFSMHALHTRDRHLRSALACNQVSTVAGNKAGRHALGCVRGGVAGLMD
jgi:hypothetical protein